MYLRNVHVLVNVCRLLIFFQMAATLALQLIEKHSDGFESILCQNVIGTDLNYVNNQLDKKSMLEWARCSAKLIIRLKHGESTRDLACTTKEFQVIQDDQSAFIKKGV